MIKVTISKIFYVSITINKLAASCAVSSGDFLTKLIFCIWLICSSAISWFSTISTPQTQFNKIFHLGSSDFMAKNILNIRQWSGCNETHIRFAKPLGTFFTRNLHLTKFKIAKPFAWGFAAFIEITNLRRSSIMNFQKINKIQYKINHPQRSSSIQCIKHVFNTYLQ